MNTKSIKRLCACCGTAAIILGQVLAIIAGQWFHVVAGGILTLAGAALCAAAMIIHCELED